MSSSKTLETLDLAENKVVAGQPEDVDGTNVGERTRAEGVPKGDERMLSVEKRLSLRGGEIERGAGPVQLSAYPESMESSRWHIESKDSRGTERGAASLISMGDKSPPEPRLVVECVLAC